MSTTTACPRCGHDLPATPIPVEPPIGTWVKDRHGAVSKHFTVGTVAGWSQPGCMPFGQWEAMWTSRGPLTVCGPWGAELTEESSDAP